MEYGTPSSLPDACVRLLLLAQGYSESGTDSCLSNPLRDSLLPIYTVNIFGVVP